MALERRAQRESTPQQWLRLVGGAMAAPSFALGRFRECQGRCWLVDISKGGLAVKINDDVVQEGTILHLQFLMAKKLVDITTRVVYIEKREAGYCVGVESLSELDDIVAQLFPQ